MKLLMLPGGICFTQLAPNLQRGSPELESRDQEMQAFPESTGLPPVAFWPDRVYPNGIGPNVASYASSPDPLE